MIRYVLYFNRRFFAAVLLVLLPCSAAAFNVRLSSDVLHQGDTLSVWIDGDLRPDRFVCRMSDREHLFHKAAGGIRSLIGIPADISAGERTLTVVKKRFLIPKKVLKKVNILKKEFPEIVLSISENKKKLTSDPSNSDQLELFRKLIDTESAQQQWEGRFSVPAQGRHSSLYGELRKLTRGERWNQHKGLDIAAIKGTRVCAPESGTVIFCGELNLQGNTVIIDHGHGVISVFMHLDRFMTGCDKKIEQGEPIGTIGSTGFSSGNHLHWGLYIKGVAVDPVIWTENEF